MNGRAWLFTSWTGRIFAGAIVLKGLLFLGLWATGGSLALEYADRAVNLALIVLASVSLVDITLRMRGRLLWRVRRKLILSYILIGAVPFLLPVPSSDCAVLASSTGRSTITA